MEIYSLKGRNSKKVDRRLPKDAQRAELKEAETASVLTWELSWISSRLRFCVVLIGARKRMSFCEVQAASEYISMKDSWFKASDDILGDDKLHLEGFTLKPLV